MATGFYNDRLAGLYYKADSAKQYRCMVHDQHVHGADSESQICDSCASDAVALRCATDNMSLYHECDLDAQDTCSIPAAHDHSSIIGLDNFPCRSRLQGFDRALESD